MRTVAVIELVDGKLKIQLPKTPDAYEIGRELEKRLKE